MSDEDRTATARRGPMRLTRRAAGGSSEVMFVVPKAVGNAVTRNRVRRRLRAALQDLVRDGAVELGGAEYRLSVFAPLEGFSAPQLRAALDALLKDVHR